MCAKSILVVGFIMVIIDQTTTNYSGTFGDLNDIWYDSVIALRNILDDKLNFLKEQLDNFEYFDSIGSSDLELENISSISSFLLLKRLSIDRERILDTIHSVADILYDFNNYTLEVPWENVNSLEKVALAIARLQDTYKVNVSSLVKSSSELPMLVEDYLDMGILLSESDELSYAEMWLKEAQSNWENSENAGPNGITVYKKILESLVGVYERQGDYRETLKTIQTLKITFSGDNLYLLKEQDINKKLLTNQSVQIKNITIQEQQQLEIDIRYKQLCRHEIKRHPRMTAALKCRFMNGNPFLKIAPLKLEEYSHNPYIVMYHDVISDKEIDVIKELAYAKFEPSKIGSAAAGIILNENRTSRTGWLQDNEHPIIRDLSDRVEDMTGLTKIYSEMLQVVNYGIGQHYGPHYDFDMKVHSNKTFDEDTGSRIATVLFYMNDVVAGGATVFPVIDITVAPRKGSALFWYNLYRSGVGNLYTAHAACPVLIGTKWVCNKWLHEFGQEFRRPCSLTPDNP